MLNNNSIIRDEPFFSSKLKIERAKRHICELNSDVSAFLKRNPYKIIINKGPQSGQCSWTIRVRKNIPEHFAVIIGDAVHNLRTSLDLLACDLVRLNEQSTDGVYFPFCLKRDDFENAIKKRHIDRATPQVVDIIRTLHPYKGGLDYLRAIHDLDITDKHQLLIPIFHCVNVPYFSIDPDSPFPTDQIFFTYEITDPNRVKDGDVLLITPITNEIKFGQNLKITFEIAFGIGQPMERQPIIPTLHQFAALVEGIVEMFRPFWVRCSS